MKILRIIRSISPESGGPIEGIKQFEQPLQQAGHVSEIVSLDAADADFISNSPIPVYALGPGLGNYGYSYQLTPWLAAHCADYDAFIVHGLWQYPGFAAHRVFKQKEIP